MSRPAHKDLMSFRRPPAWNIFTMSTCSLADLFTKWRSLLSCIKQDYKWFFNIYTWVVQSRVQYNNQYGSQYRTSSINNVRNVNVSDRDVSPEAAQHVWSLFFSRTLRLIKLRSMSLRKACFDDSGREKRLPERIKKQAESINTPVAGLCKRLPPDHLTQTCNSSRCKSFISSRVNSQHV